MVNIFVCDFETILFAVKIPLYLYMIMCSGFFFPLYIYKCISFVKHIVCVLCSRKRYHWISIRSHSFLRLLLFFVWIKVNIQSRLLEFVIELKIEFHDAYVLRMSFSRTRTHTRFVSFRYYQIHVKKDVQCHYRYLWFVSFKSMQFGARCQCS